ncbi:MAG TPA: ABC transporter permease [Candidatus Limnocylindria bacterium]|nr:ABC transporter permease [Candidatus Limnocylindria bacterium]
MGRYVLRRLIQAIPTLFGIMLLTFILTRFSPADPVRLMLAGQTDLTPEDRAALATSLGLDRPLPIQFADYVWDTVRLDFGNSFYYHRPAIQMIAERIPNTAQLAVTGLVVSLLIGVPLGILAALYRGRAADHGIRFSSVLATAMPDFFLGLLFILFLGVQLRWFPIGSMNTIGETCGLCWDRVWHMVGPVLLYANGGLAVFPRFLRTEMLEILAQDYIRTARSKGLREKLVVGTHALRNALIPVVTLLGGILAIAFSGSVIVESIFTWPGIGRLAFEAANAKDYPVVQAVVIVSSFLLVLSYILRDIAYAWVDPRIRIGK